MRALLAKDIAPFTKIIAKMELKDSIKNMFATSKKKEDKDERGAMVTELVWGVIENYSKAEKEFFEFLAGMEDKTAEEIAELPLPEFINLVTELFGEKNLPFFKSAAK